MIHPTLLLVPPSLMDFDFLESPLSAPLVPAQLQPESEPGELARILALLKEKVEDSTAEILALKTEAQSVARRLDGQEDYSTFLGRQLAEQKELISKQVEQLTVLQKQVQELHQGQLQLKQGDLNLMALDLNPDVVAPFPAIEWRDEEKIKPLSLEYKPLEASHALVEQSPEPVQTPLPIPPFHMGVEGVITRFPHVAVMLGCFFYQIAFMTVNGLTVALPCNLRGVMCVAIWKTAIKTVFDNMVKTFPDSLWARPMGVKQYAEGAIDEMRYEFNAEDGKTLCGVMAFFGKKRGPKETSFQVTEVKKTKKRKAGTSDCQSKHENGSAYMTCITLQSVNALVNFALRHCDGDYTKLPYQCKVDLAPANFTHPRDIKWAIEHCHMRVPRIIAGLPMSKEIFDHVPIRECLLSEALTFVPKETRARLQTTMEHVGYNCRIVSGPGMTPKTFHEVVAAEIGTSAEEVRRNWPECARHAARSTRKSRTAALRFK